MLFICNKCIFLCVDDANKICIVLYCIVEEILNLTCYSSATKSINQNYGMVAVEKMYFKQFFWDRLVPNTTMSDLCEKSKSHTITAQNL